MSPPSSPARSTGSRDQDMDDLIPRRQSSSLTSLMEKAASICNQVIVEKCGMCTVYSQGQLEYEIFHANAQSPMWMNSLYDDSELVAAKHRMFDEESVVDSISARS